MSDRTLRAIITGDSAGAVRAFEETAAASDAAAGQMEDRMGAATSKVGGFFGKLGSTLGNWGIPFAESLTKVGEKFDDVEGHAASAWTKISTLGGVALASVAVGAVGVGAEAVHLASAFDTATSKIAATAGITQTAARKIGDAFLTTGFQSTFTATEMANAYAPVSAQLATVEGHALSASQALTVMKATTDLAEASGTSLTATTAALADTMQVYGLKVKTASGASDILYNASRAVNVSVTTVASAADKLKTKLGIAAPTLATTATLMTDLGEHGIQGTRGISTVTSAMSTLLGGSAAVATELAALGVSVYNATGKFIGMKTTIAELSPKLAAMTTAQRKAAEATLFGKTAATSMNTVISGGVASYTKAAAAVTKLGTAHTAATKQTNNLHGQIEKLKAGLEDEGVKIGDFLIPKLEDLAHGVEDVIGWFEKHKTVAEALGIAIGVTLAGAITVFTVNKLASLISSTKDAITTFITWGAKIDSAASKLLGLGSSTSKADAALTATKKATTAVAASYDSAGARSAAYATSVQIASTDAEVAAAAQATSIEGSMAEVGAASEAAAGEEGVGAIAGGLGGLVGPIGLVAGLFGAKLLPAFESIFNTGPTWSKVDTWVTTLKKKLTALPTSNLTQIATAIHTAAGAAATQQTHAATTTPNTTAGAEADKGYTAAITKEQALSAQSAHTAANQAVLQQALGLTSTQAGAVATAVGVKLTGALKKFTVAQIIGHMKQYGTATQQAAATAAASAASIAASANTGAKGVIAADAVMTTGHKAALELMFATSQQTGAAAIAALANSVKGGLPILEEQLKAVGVTIPKKYLDELNTSMTVGGKISMTKLALAISAQQGKVSAGFHDVVTRTTAHLTTLKTKMTATGGAAMTALIAAITAKKTDLSTKAEAAITAAITKIGSHKKDLGPIGTQLIAGLTAAIDSGKSSVVNSMEQMITAAVQAAQAKAKISSPSRLFAETVGQWIPKGVAAGIDEYAHLPGQSLANMLGGMAGHPTAGGSLGGPGPIPGAGYGGGSDGPVSISITVNAATSDPNGLALQLRTSLRTVLYQKKRAVGNLKLT